MKTLAEIDWSRWLPTDRATLLFVVEDGRILLIEKKRGLGAGKVNGPGGRIEAGEEPMAGALRELREELGVDAEGVALYGELLFQFADGYALHCLVFRADRCLGEAIETGEAVPLWTALDRIPFERMWADDALWLPLLLERRSFHGRFLFDGDRMLDHELVTPPQASMPG